MKLLLVLLLFGCSHLYAQSSLKNSVVLGEKIYLRKCATCHGKSGLGKEKRIPPLANSDYLTNNQESSIRGILFGLKGEITVNGVNYNRKMKAVKLSDLEVANVMNFIQNSWGNKNKKSVTKEAVAKIRTKH
ncbi:c-type cytochrome [Croceitalea marina]|uniref:C-type cytochrome n=1 Tax=Croceitalea marina TaxID=1775166 RepID=A0ABW5N168_9FLAO